MSIVELVEKRILDDPSILLVHKKSPITGFPVQPNTLVYQQDFYVAPKKPLYAEEDLNLFMLGCYPETAPDYVTKFRGHDDGSMDFGRVFYSDVVGSDTRTIIHKVTLNDEFLQDYFSKSGKISFEGGKVTLTSTQTYDYKSQAVIHPFPSKDIAIAALSGSLNSPYSIEGDDFKKFKRKDASRPKLRIVR